MSKQAMTEILAAVANGEGAADTDTVAISLGALRALVRQEPYAYEHGRTNGDGTFSVVIDKGDLVRVSDTVYKNGPPRNPVKDWPVKPLYAAPVVAGRAVPDDVARDAARYRFLRDCGLSKLPYEDFGCGPAFANTEELDAQVDAMLAAAKKHGGDK